MYYLTECLIIKNENQYLREHILTNARAGIDFFYIYDNESTIPVYDYLKETAPELLKICSIERYSAPPDCKNPQSECYKKFLSEHKNGQTWCAFIDTDEIFSGNLKQFCKGCENVANLLIFKGLVIGANNKAFYENKPLKERFNGDIVKRWGYNKNVVQTRFLIEQSAHKSILTPSNFSTIYYPENVRLLHYYYKSLEEYIWKIQRGSAQNTIRHFKNFFDDNKINETDVKILMQKYNIDFDFCTIKK